MDTPTPPPVTPPQRTTAFAHQAAKASWVSAIIVFVLAGFAGRTGARVVIEFFLLVLMLVGFALGAAALVGIRKHGAKGLLAPALIGITLNGLLALIFITNFSAARARAQRDAKAMSAFLPATPAPSREDGRRIYQGDGLVFSFPEAYGLRTNQASGQVLLHHDDSSVVVTRRRDLVDTIETLKDQASALQQDFTRQSYSELTQSDVETIAGTIRSGGLVRVTFDKPGAGRIHADVYVLSDRVTSISLLHFYSDTRESEAQRLFQTVLQSLKDGV